jgi:hypothetical protein
LNNEVPEKSIQTPDRIVQKYEPIFMKPVSQNGRAQFYAPYKIFGNREIDTYWFNILVIGAVTIILYVILYYNLLRKLVSFFENLRVQRSDDIIISY